MPGLASVLSVAREENMSEHIFRHLTEAQQLAMYEKLRAKGMTADAAYNEIREADIRMDKEAKMADMEKSEWLRSLSVDDLYEILSPQQVEGIFRRKDFEYYREDVLFVLKDADRCGYSMRELTAAEFTEILINKYGEDSKVLFDFATDITQELVDDYDSDAAHWSNVHSAIEFIVYEAIDHPERYEWTKEAPELFKKEAEVSEKTDKDKEDEER